MSIAYIQSNLLRRTLLVLSLIGFPLLLLVLAAIEFWHGGFKNAWRFVKWECTQGNDGFWSGVAACWKAPAKRCRCTPAQRMAGRYDGCCND